MKIASANLIIALSAVVLATSCTEKIQPKSYAEKPGVSWASVLRETFDLKTLTSPVMPYEKSVHFSSSATTGRVILANLAPEILGDMDHGFFLDVKQSDAGVDATLAETTGAGMVTWIWSANPTGILRLFIDNRDTPVMEVPFAHFIDGSFLPHSWPFAAVTANGHNLHFPIIHKDYCRIEIRVPKKEDLSTLYYQIAWNPLDSTETIHPFDAGDIADGKELLESLAKIIADTQELSPGEPTNEILIPPGSGMPIFSSRDSGTISSIAFATPDRADLASLHIRAYWDDSPEPAIDCPLHLLGGISSRMESSSSLPVTIQGNRMEVRWPMPYQTARVEIANIGDRAVSLQSSVSVDKDPSPLRFRTTTQQHRNLRTENKNILTLADILGSGRIVGCNIVVHTRTSKWWGEGDQLIYLDSTSEPTWRGTGTEDYFGFAWCSTKTFDHPLRGQSSVTQSGAERTSSMHRYHVLDRLPFHSFASFKTEAWGLAEGAMDYESLVLYYSE
jgi:hypothetical protein